MHRSVSPSCIILILLMVSTISCATITPAPTVQPASVPILISSSPTPEMLPVSPPSTLFLVDATGRLEYRFTLFHVEDKNLKTQNADFSTTGWDVTLGSSNRGEFIHYNPSTKEIIFVLSPAPSGDGGWKPADALPDPPFRFAIYKTSFESQNQFTQLYAEASDNFFIEHMVLNPHDNSLFIDVDTYGEARHPEILKFDIGTGQFETIANIETVFSGKDLVERSDLRLSPNGQNLYQLVLYGDPQKWTNETLYLMTINLQDRSVNYQEIVTGGNVQYDILATSADGNIIAYYTMDTEQYNLYHLWVKDLKNDNVKFIGNFTNFNLFMTSDGQKILVGFQEGTQENIRFYWQIFDLKSNEYQSTPIDMPLAWNSSGRYLAGTKDASYIIYDTETLTELELGLSLPDDYIIQSVQWR